MVMAAILDAILNKTVFEGSDCGRLLVCYSPLQIPSKTVEKHFVTISLGLGGIQPYIDPTNIQYDRDK